MKSNAVNVKELEQVTGGSSKESKELMAFIKRVDPKFTLYSDFDVANWLTQRSGIRFGDMNLSSSWMNDYTLANGESVDHSKLMSMLEERFSNS